MREGKLQIYCGSGKGKTTAALGQAIKEASLGRSVFVVQFMKCRKADEEISFIQRIMNMKNGLNFAKKVLATGECDVLILDEVLGLVEQGIVSAEEVHELLGEASDTTELIFTGIKLCPEMMDWADDVYQITALKES